jgi:hypothetical protein
MPYMPLILPTIPIMPRFQKKIKRLFGVVFALNHSISASCSGAIEQIQNFGATHTHRVGKSSSSTYSLILAQSPRTTTLNRGFSAPTFEAAIGGAV